MAKANQSNANFDRLFGVENDSAGRGVAGLMLLDPALIETLAQPRTQFEEGPLNELANSIRERRERTEGIEGTGLLQPLLVTRGTRESYRLIAGERRLRAALRLGLPLVPAVVVADNPRETLANQLVENLQRAGLNPLEEGRAFAAWMKENSLSVREAAQAVGKDKNYISNRVRLLKMGEDVQQMVSQRADALVHAQLIDPLKNPQQRAELIAAVVQKEISVAELRQQLQPNPQDEPAGTSLPGVSLRRDTPERRDTPQLEDEVSTSRTGAPTEAIEQAPHSQAPHSQAPHSQAPHSTAVIEQMRHLLDQWPSRQPTNEREKKSLLKSLDALSKKLSELRQHLES